MSHAIFFSLYLWIHHRDFDISPRRFPARSVAATTANIKFSTSKNSVKTEMVHFSTNKVRISRLFPFEAAPSTASAAIP